MHNDALLYVAMVIVLVVMELRELVLCLEIFLFFVFHVIALNEVSIELFNIFSSYC